MNISVPQPPWSGTGKKLESAFRKALYDFKMLENDQPELSLEKLPLKIAVALSGGKDSLTLLFLLKAVSGKGFPELDINAILVEGEFSCGAGVNVNYLQKICDALGVNFITKQSKQRLENLECYSCSRERRSLIFGAAKEIGATTIAFGHHRDDHAQTVMMNLLHKGEFAGLLPKILMHEYGVTIIRPLIYSGEKEITIFAEQNGFLRIMCKCPVGQNSMRKKVKEMIEEIELLYPNALKNIAQAGLIYGSDKASTV